MAAPVFIDRFGYTVRHPYQKPLPQSAGKAQLQDHHRTVGASPSEIGVFPYDDRGKTIQI